jgi:hypothetical protein
MFGSLLTFLPTSPSPLPAGGASSRLRASRGSAREPERTDGRSTGKATPYPRSTPLAGCGSERESSYSSSYVRLELFLTLSPLPSIAPSAGLLRTASPSPPRLSSPLPSSPSATRLLGGVSRLTFSLFLLLPMLILLSLLTSTEPSSGWLNAHVSTDLSFTPPSWWGVISLPSRSWTCSGSGKDGWSVDWRGNALPSGYPAGWLWFGTYVTISSTLSSLLR